MKIFFLYWCQSLMWLDLCSLVLNFSNNFLLKDPNRIFMKMSKIRFMIGCGRLFVIHYIVDGLGMDDNYYICKDYLMILEVHLTRNWMYYCAN